MSESSPNRVSFDLSPRPAGRRPTAAEGSSSLLIIADFSGRTSRGENEPFAARRLLPLDADGFSNAPLRCGAALALPRGHAPSGTPPESDSATLRFRSLDDFHPDALVKRVPALASLFVARRALDSPETAGAAADSLRHLLSNVESPTGLAEPAPFASTSESEAQTLARLLGQAPGASPPKVNPKGFDVQAFIHQVLAASSSKEPALPPGMAGVISAAELELAARLRAVLHHPPFRTLEAAWRSAEFLVRRCPDEEKLTLFLLDASLAEWSGNLAAVRKLLLGRRWAGIVADFVFGATVEDLEALRGLAATSAALGCCVIAGAHPQLVGCDSFEEHPNPDDWNGVVAPELRAAWQALRGAPEAQHVVLALPRFLLRQPYGAGSDPIESFAFEEILDPTSSDAYLWGNSAVLCAQLLAEALAAPEDEFRFAGAGEIGELPVFRFTKDGERAIHPCAEAWLTDRAAEVILGHGLSPVLSIKGRDSVRVVVRSIAEPARPLALVR